MKLTVPSKTFLLGEYGVLKKSPAIVICTGPCFEMHVEPKSEPSDQNELIGIDLESIAGRFYRTHIKFFKNFRINFIDPWKTSGGFGASSAQFGLLYALKHKMTPHDLNTVSYEFLNNMRIIFRDMSWHGVGLPPSGADLIAQWVGGVCHLDFENQIAESMKWSSRLSFVIIKTQNKISTHIHLQDIEDLMDQEYALIAKRGVNALKNNDDRNIQLAIQAQFQLLERNELITPESREVIKQIYNSGLAQATKGCGAMGADVILSLVKKENLQQFLAWCDSKKLTIVATENNLSKGLQIENHEDLYESLAERSAR